MRTLGSICLGVPNILLPKPGTDLTKWAVIACDQYTSEPEYWKRVEQQVGVSRSTLELVYPEVYLDSKDRQARIARIRENMKSYMEQELFEESAGFLYLERKIGPRIRKGIMVCLDLEQYDFRKGSTSMIRATEGTILDRIPPRVQIREGAIIELPHIMVLIDDPENRVIGPLTENKNRLTKVYDFDLMLGSGQLTGYRVDDETLEDNLVEGLTALADPDAFLKKYNLTSSAPVLLYAMGDGNHSLATAKTIWENAKEKAVDKSIIMASPLRYALVELVNLHDKALVFEPIHRVLFGTDSSFDLNDQCGLHYGSKCKVKKIADLDELKRLVDGQTGKSHVIGFMDTKGYRAIEVESPDSNLPVGSIQGFLDAVVARGQAREIDYVHGSESVTQLSKIPGNLGVYLPAMKKQDLFKTVILDGVLPRKTFSMGEAWEKRFYMEARRIG